MTGTPPRPLPPVPTGRGIGLLLAGFAVAAAGASTRHLEFIWFGVLLLLLVLTGVGYGLVRRWWDHRLRIGRVLTPPQLQVGRTAAMDLVIASGVPPWSTLTDRVPAGVRRGGAGASTTIEPLRRGLLELGPVMLSGTDPFALARWRRVVAPVERALVWPRTDAVDVERSWGDVRTTAQTAGHPAGRIDDATLREYRPGDPLERVHWKASARHSTMLVRQEDPSEDDLFHVVLALGGADDAMSDRLVDVAASLLASIHEEGWALRLWLPDASGHLTSQPVGDLAAVLSRLALLPAGVERTPARGTTPPPGTLGGTLVLVLGSERPESVEDLLAWAAHPGVVYLPEPASGSLPTRFDSAGWLVETV